MMSTVQFLDFDYKLFSIKGIKGTSKIYVP